MPRIHQFLAGFTNGDAISNEAVTMRSLFRSWGCVSDIFSETARILPELRPEARDVADGVATARPDDVAILHLSIGSAVNEAFAALPCRKAILYHNVTPPHYFDLINRQTALHLARGHEQVARLAGTAEVNLADSQFNADELTALGYANVRVLPLVLDFHRLAETPDRRVGRRFRDGKVNVLFVGRVAPNKKIEDALAAFFVFNRCIEPESRFIQVGSFAGAERYYYLLLTQVKEFGGGVHFAGSVPQAQLNAYYACADVFLCMSEHEGFCIPIMESMAHDVPVLAYAAAAVPETMDGAGVLFREKRHEAVAEMMGCLVRDATLRASVIRGQRARLARYRERDLGAELRSHLAPLMGG